MDYRITISPTERKVRSENYNYDFDLKTGRFARWGKDYQDDPNFAPAPEILNIELLLKKDWRC